MALLIFRYDDGRVKDLANGLVLRERSLGAQRPGNRLDGIRGLPSCNSFISRLTCWSVFTLAPGIPGRSLNKTAMRESDPKNIVVAAAAAGIAALAISPSRVQPT